MKPVRLIAVAGPTAVGKSALAVALAKALNGEIISADSMQIYRGMDIGTAKPTPAEQAEVPHHLIDIRAPAAGFSVAEFQRLAVDAIAEVTARGRQPILSGGTGLYMRAVLYEWQLQAPRADANVRARLQAEAAKKGSAALHARLEAIDPIVARRIHHHDERRIIRALEVFMKTGTPISQLQRTDQPARYDCLMIGLTMRRPDLYQRIEQRVEEMVAAGWLDEVHSLLVQGCSPYKGPLLNLGYRELTAYMRGQSTITEAVEWAKRNTRRYAKRQLTWLRREPNIHWVSMDGGFSGALEEVLGLAAGMWPRRKEDQSAAETGGRQ